jgi:hypothetical protein
MNGGYFQRVNKQHKGNKMAITIPTPIEIPASPAQIASKLWILSLNIMAPDPSKPVRAMIAVCPMTDAGVLLIDKKKSLIINDLLALAQTDTTIATAVESIYNAVQTQVVARKLYT